MNSDVLLVTSRIEFAFRRCLDWSNENWFVWPLRFAEDLFPRNRDARMRDRSEKDDLLILIIC
jgi:hypothetical protein